MGEKLEMEKVIDMLKESPDYVFQGDEKKFEEHVFEHLDLVCEGLNLPEIYSKKRQVFIKFEGTRVLMDIVVRHIDGSATIFEVKTPSLNNPQVSPSLQMAAVGQLLLYGNVFEARTEVKPRLVLIDTKIHLRTMYAFSGNNLPITLIEFQNDRIFVPYNAL